jgi:SpoVK/Ycf46/Vps4 family AAA+-type ATPase
LWARQPLVSRQVDKLGKRSDVSTDSGVRRNLFSTLLSWLASPRKSIVIATTNVPEQLDDAFIRAGRFDAKV